MSLVIPKASHSMMKNYGNPDALMEWEYLREEMMNADNYWICSTRPDGRPSVGGLIALGTGSLSVVFICLLIDSKRKKCYLVTFVHLCREIASEKDRMLNYRHNYITIY